MLFFSYREATKVVFLNSADLDLNELTGLDLFLGFKEYLAVDLGSVEFASAKVIFADGVKILAKHGQGSAYTRLILFLVNSELRLHQNIHSVLLYLLVDLTVKVVCGSALLTLVGEYTRAVKSLGLDELGKLTEVLLGLTGEANDKGRTDNYVGDFALELLKHLADHRALAVSVHTL